MSHNSDQDRWEQRYADGDLPWDTGVPDPHLIRLVRAWPGQGLRALDIGCGTGTNAVWLAGQGWRVTGIDLSARAIGRARTRAEQAGADIRFLCDDFLTCDRLEPDGFDFLFDRGCFHAMDGPETRRRFADRCHGLLTGSGLWLSLIGNSDDTSREGPPRLSAGEIVEAVESRFEILGLQPVIMTDARGRTPLFWQCLGRRRQR